MKLEQQVCSLDLAKRLKELGVKQDGQFAYWLKNDNKLSIFFGMSLYAIEGSDFSSLPNDDDWVSAFTVAELGQAIVKLGTFELPVYFDGHGWHTPYAKFEEMDSDTEADARAKMLCYLLENGLIRLVA
jgi:hypothetical protein